MNTVIKNEKVYQVEMTDDRFVEIYTDGNQIATIDLFDLAQEDRDFTSDYIDGYDYYNDEATIEKWQTYEYACFEPNFQCYSQFYYFCENWALADFFQKQGLGRDFLREFEDEDEADSYISTNWGVGDKIETDSEKVMVTV